jgi:CubicO group peptidase (beta-lactamase class C family)
MDLDSYLHQGRKVHMANFASLERAMERCMEMNWLGGYSAYIARADEPPYVRYTGFADREEGIPIRENTLFRAMSMAKPMTAAAAMALVERGKLRLDDPVRKYAPCAEWVYDENGTRIPLPADRDLTVLHLLNHTNGLGMSDSHMGEIFKATEGRDDGLAMWAEAAATVPLEFLPGTRTGYSSYVGFTLLGRVLKVAADMSFRDVLQTYLHEPLGMEPPKFHLEAGEMPRLSRVYETTEDGLAPEP